MGMSLTDLDAATEYAAKAVSREIVVGWVERLACQRHLDDLARQGEVGFE